MRQHSVFPHQRLKVYKTALSFAAWVKKHCGYLPISASLKDQLRRASSGIVLNVAEGAAQRSRAMQAKHFSIALASAAECSAALDLAALGGAELAEQQDELAQVGAMLRGLLK